MGMTGGCLCAAVRYELASEPFDCGWCHCRLCQLSSGSPAMTFATVASDDLRWVQGSEHLKSVASTSFGHREFCDQCGTALTIRVEYQPDTVDFPIATLDEPDAVAPGFHIFWGSKVAWFNPGDDLPKYDKFRPNTRGLEGIEPPS